MSTKPVFVATHPRACSTAFERVFMTRRDTLTCVHEPFGDAFYFGPERLSERYEKHEKDRVDSGFGNSTYKTILDRIEREGSEGKRLFIKDITHYLVPPNGKPASIAPSFLRTKKGVGTEASSVLTTAASPSPDATAVETNGSANGTALKPPYPYPTAAEPHNPTVLPAAILKQFHFTFLIRHPRSSIPSYYRCTIPPLDEVTGFYDFMPSEAGYDEVRRVFDYLRSIGQIGPNVAGQADSNGANQHDKHDKHNATNGTPDATTATTNGTTPSSSTSNPEICVIDADDLLANPSGMIAAYCKTVGLDYDPRMLKWDTEADHLQAKAAFEKWTGFHDDAIQSCELKARGCTKTPKTPHDEDEEWRVKYGDEGARVIRETVDANVKDYEYLKGFALRV